MRARIGPRLEEVEEDGAGQVVGQVSHDHQRRAVAPERLEVDGLGVGGDHAHGGRRGEGLLEDRHQVAVTLHGDDVGAGLGEAGGEMAESGAELDHPVTLTHLGDVGDAIEDQGFPEEVLPPGLLRRQAVPIEELPDAGVSHPRRQPGSALRSGPASSPATKRW